MPAYQPVNLPGMNWGDYQSGALAADTGLLDMLSSPLGGKGLMMNAEL